MGSLAWESSIGEHSSLTIRLKTGDCGVKSTPNWSVAGTSAVDITLADFRGLAPRSISRISSANSSAVRPAESRKSVLAPSLSNSSARSFRPAHIATCRRVN